MQRFRCHTLSQQWKIESFSRHQKGSFSSHSTSSAWRSPSVAGCSETEGHYWPWTQTVRWVRTIQPYIISLSQHSKETLTEKLREKTNSPEKVQGKDAEINVGCGLKAQDTSEHLLNVLFRHSISSCWIIKWRTKNQSNIKKWFVLMY